MGLRVQHIISRRGIRSILHWRGVVGCGQLGWGLGLRLNRSLLCSGSNLKKPICNLLHIVVVDKMVNHLSGTENSISTLASLHSSENVDRYRYSKL